jgi:hypothetical protein
MAALVVLAEAVVLAHATRLVDFFVLYWPWTGRAGRLAAASSQVLCFGDRMVKFRLSPPRDERHDRVIEDLEEFHLILRLHRSGTRP